MTKPVFGPAEMAAWENAFTTRLPSEIKDEDIPAMPQVESMLAIVLNVGIGFRMTTRDGDEIDILMNPVAARRMAGAILKHGQEEGWLSETGEVIAPLRARDH